MARYTREFFSIIDPVTMVTGVLCDVSKSHRLSLVFRAGSKSFRYRVSTSRRSLQLKRTAAVIQLWRHNIRYDAQVARLVSSINRVQQQSGYEPEPRNWNCSWLQATREQALVATYTALGNAVADVADSK